MLRGTRSGSRFARPTTSRSGDSPFDTGLFGGDGADASGGAMTAKGLQRVLQSARADGRLNLPSRGLDEVPEDVWLLYAPPSETDYSLNKSSSWWEAVDLVRFNVADNRISALDERIGEFGALEFVDVHNNRLSSLPDSFATLQNVAMVNISFNEFSEVPGVLQHLPKLSVLLLSSNRIASVPPSLIASAQSLTHLDLSRNQLILLPSLAGLTQLVKLVLSQNALTELPNISGLSKLTDLEASENKISSIAHNGTGRIQLPSLTRLDLRQNYISDASVLGIRFDAPQLKEVIVSFNALKTLTFMLVNNTAVQILDMRDNQFDEIPEEVLALQQLKRIDFQNNNVRALPPRMGLLKELTFIGLEGNILKGLPRNVGTTGLLKWLAAKIEQEVVKEAPPPSRASNAAMPLSASQESISDGAVPRVTGSRVVIVDLSQQQVTADGLVSLRDRLPSTTSSLDLSKNLLTPALPAAVFAPLQSLRELTVSHNQLTQFDFSILPASIVTLELNHNKITTLTPTNTPLNLPNLSTLNLSFNQLTAFALDLGTTAISLLVLTSNRIADISPDTVLAMSSTLAQLDISNNALAKLPVELGKCPQLKMVKVEGNCFRVPRYDVVQRGSDAVIKWCKDRCGVH
ncbi:hypothetical protein RI367_005501 [Sorochytrium milnesiophthora]